MDFEQQLKEFGEYGIVEKITYPIVQVSGLPNVYNREIVLFENGSTGEIFSLHENYADILMFSRDLVELGSRVTRTGKFVSIPLCKEMLGNIIDPFGAFLQGYPAHRTHEELREIDFIRCDLPERRLIKEPLITGYSVVDSVIPLGKGQRELVLGDEKTGKTSFLLGAMKAHVNAGGLAVYAMIGGKKQEVSLILEYVQREKIFDRCVILFSACDDAPGSIYYTPYAAMTVAEYLSQFQEDVLIILDDLTTHAKYYREMALLAGKYPGRDSYPGDIFYSHSRLLERAGVIQGKDDKVRSITCLPVGNTTDSDLTDYIISNLISITDGHLLFDRKQAQKGRVPPIHIGLSVSRVGKQTRTPLLQDVNRTTLNFLISKYEKAYTMSHFGEEMSREPQIAMQTGELLYQFFNQNNTLSVPPEIQVVFITMILSGCFNDINQDIKAIRDDFVLRYQSHKDLQAEVQTLMKHKTYNELTADILNRKDYFLALCKTQKT